MKRKIEKKLSLSKETLRSLDEISLTGVAGGLTATGPCSLCTVCETHCVSCYNTCMLNTEGVCC